MPSLILQAARHQRAKKGSNLNLTSRSASLANLWAPLLRKIAHSSAEGHVGTWECEILAADGETWIKSTVEVLDGKVLVGKGLNIGLRGQPVTALLDMPLIQIGQQVLIRADPSQFPKLTAAVFAWVNTRPAGILNKQTVVESSASKDESDLLVCQMEAHFTAYNSQSSSWMHVIGRLKHSGYIELWTEGVCVYQLDIRMLEERSLRRVDISLVKSSFVIFIVPDLGGPESAYLKFSEEVDFDDWYGTLVGFSRLTLYSPLNGDEMRSVRFSHNFVINISAGRSSSSLAGTYVDISANDWVAARTVVNYESSGANWGQKFYFDNIDESPLQLTLRKINGPGQRPSELDEPIGNFFWAPPYAEVIGTWHTVGNGADLFFTAKSEKLAILDLRQYSKIRQLLRDFSLTEALAECPSSVLTPLTSSLVDFYRAEGKHAKWASYLAERESGSTSEVVFRGNTLLSRVLEKLLILHGRQALMNTVGRFVRKVSQQRESLEVDPSRLPSDFPTEVMMARMKTLRYYVEYIWELIRLQPLPPSLKHVFAHLPQQGLAAFVFLRFYCPALLNPRQYGLSEYMLFPSQRRTLTLVAKILQGFANRVNFGAKEPWLEPMNSFIKTHDDELVNWYHEIASGGASRDRAPKLLPIHRAMGADRSNPYLVDLAATLASLVELCTPLEFDSPKANEFCNECRRISNVKETILSELEKPDTPVNDFILHLNTGSLLFGLDSQLLEAPVQDEALSDQQTEPRGRKGLWRMFKRQ